MNSLVKQSFCRTYQNLQEPIQTDSLSANRKGACFRPLSIGGRGGVDEASGSTNAQSEFGRRRRPTVPRRGEGLSQSRINPSATPLPPRHSVISWSCL